MACDAIVMHPDVNRPPGNPAQFYPGMIVDIFGPPDPRYPLNPGIHQDPAFIVVRFLDDILMDEVLVLAQQVYDIDGNLIHQRAKSFDYGALNPTQMTNLRTTRELNVTRSQFTWFVSHMMDL